MPTRCYYTLAHYIVSFYYTHYSYTYNCFHCDCAIYMHYTSHKTTAAQNEDALICCSVRGLYFLAVVFAVTTII